LKKLLPYLLRITAGLIGLVLILYIVVWVYVSYHKQSILQHFKKEINKRINGELSIGDMDFSFFHEFPKVSIGLYKIVLRDSLWEQHHHDLLQAEKVFISLNPLKLFSSTLSVDQISFENASAYFFTDSTGYSNTAFLRPQSSSSKKESGFLPSIKIKDSKIFIEKLDRHKFFSFEIKKVNVDVKNKEIEKAMLLNIDLSALIHNLAFNTKNGSFLEEKTVSGKINVKFNPGTKILQFENIRLQIDHHPFVLAGKFFLDEIPALFTLQLQTENIEYSNITKLLSPNIRTKMDQYTMSGKIPFIKASLDGTDPENRTPLIRINMNVKQNNITTPVGIFDSASFSGSFTNEWKRGDDHNDKNSAILCKFFSANWQDIKIKSDSVSIANLIHPILSCDLHSDFNLKAINHLTDDETIEFTKGKGKFFIKYKGPIQENDTAEKSITGTVDLDSASINYLPRNFLLTNCIGRIRLKDKDMIIDQLKAHAGSSELIMNGALKNIFSYLDKNEEKIKLDWTINSPKINLNDFISFLKKKTTETEKKKRKILFTKTVSQIMSGLNDGVVHLQLKTNQLIYKKFSATNVAGNIILNNDQMELKDGTLVDADGVLKISGSVTNDERNSIWILRSQMNKIDINRLFLAFNDFGQKGITHQNLKGILNADISMSGMITDRAEIIPNSLIGTADFAITDGELIGFEPVQKISDVVFKKRDFSDIHFAELKDKLDINGAKIKVNRMEIRSDMMTMFVEGYYNMDGKGTDMSIQIPLNNLKAKKNDELINQGIHSKTGVSIRLRAQTGEDGKLKISWDPFKKALKAKNKT